jgi:hypothetical protein
VAISARNLAVAPTLSEAIAGVIVLLVCRENGLLPASIAADVYLNGAE